MGTLNAIIFVFEGRVVPSKNIPLNLRLVESVAEE